MPILLLSNKLAMRAIAKFGMVENECKIHGTWFMTQQHLLSSLLSL